MPQYTLKILLMRERVFTHVIMLRILRYKYLELQRWSLTPLVNILIRSEKDTE